MGRLRTGSFLIIQTQSIMLRKLKLCRNSKKILDSTTNTVLFLLILETVYKNDFIPKETTVCGSKILLETKGRGMFVNSKASFT